MKTMLDEEGQIGIRQQMREMDHLAPGDSFDLERLTPGRYLLRRQPLPAESARFTVASADDGLPVIRVADGRIASRLVKEIESQTP